VNKSPLNANLTFTKRGPDAEIWPIADLLLPALKKQHPGIPDKYARRPM